MTAAVFNILPDQVIVAMDTLAMAGETGAPYFFTTKLYPLPHLQGAMFATGLGDLGTQWFVELKRFLARDVQHLDQYVTSALQELGRRFQLDEARTTTVYHVGYSEIETRYVGYAYRSSCDFESERLDYGLRVKPGVVGASIASFPEDFIRLMLQQRIEDSNRPLDERVFVGGEIQALILQDKIMTVQTIHRFDDYDDLYEQMCDALPANQQ